MKNETARREIESLDYYLQNHTNDYSEESHTAMMMAIKALEQEPCEDAIRRQAVLDLAKKGVLVSNGNYESVCKAINEIPSVNLMPCEDAINREMALKECYDIVVDGERYRVIQEETLLGLPSVTQKSDNKYRKEAKRWKNKWLKAQKSGKWIPVSERLPEENEEVLVTTEWGEVTIGERYSTNDYFINEGATNADEDEIIAWMPLPKPFEPQESEDKE